MPKARVRFEPADLDVGTEAPTAATALAWKPASQRRLTDEAGSATFDALPTSGGHLSAVAPGFAVAHRALDTSTRSADPVLLELEPGEPRRLVVLDASRSPIEGVLIRIHPGDLTAARTDRDGEATLRSTPADETVEISTDRKQGFVELPELAEGGGEPLVIQLGASETRIDEWEPVIRGQISDIEGQPVPWAEIFYWRADELPPSRDRDSKPRSGAVRQARSDDEGFFVLDRLHDEGPWNIEVRPGSGYLPAVRHGVVALPEWQADEGSILDFVLERGLLIEGRVLSIEGEPVAGAQVHVVDPVKRESASGQIASTTTDTAGHFAFEETVRDLRGLGLLVLAQGYQLKQVEIGDASGQSPRSRSRSPSIPGARFE